jgi:hypothetical protein
MKRTEREPADSESEESEGDLNENFYDLEDPFINDNDLELGTEQAFTETQSEGFYAITDSDLRKKFPEFLSHLDPTPTPTKPKIKSPRRVIVKTPKDFERYFIMLSEICGKEIIDRNRYNKVMGSVARKVFATENPKIVTHVYEKIAEITKESIDMVEHTISQKIEKCKVDRLKKTFRRSVTLVKNKIADFVRESAAGAE